MIPTILLVLVSTSLQLGFGYSITVPPSDLIPHNYSLINNGYYNYVTRSTQPPAIDHHDTIKEASIDSIYFSSGYGKDSRFTFTEDRDTDKDGMPTDDERQQKIKGGMGLLFGILDKDNDGVIIKEEIASPSVDVDDVNEFLDLYLIDNPYLSWLKTLMRTIDDDKDGFLSIEEIENNLSISSTEQKNIVRELFNYFDENVDNKISIDDLKPKMEKLLEILLKIIDVNNDGFVSFEDVDLNISWDDIISILSLINDEVMPNGQMDMNHYLIPFWFDLNEDGVVNNFDLYLSTDNQDYGWVFPVANVLKQIDQDQDGVYTIDETRNFVVKVWHILDANNDRNVSLDDIQILLKDRFHVDTDKIHVLEDYIHHIKAFIKKEGLRLADFIFQAMDRNEDEKITKPEFYQMPDICFNRWIDESCFELQGFPPIPRTLEEHQFFPQSKLPFRIFGYRIRRNQSWEQRLKSFVFSSLDSPKFHNKKGTANISKL